MIVRQAAGRVHLITQPDHAALARRVMEHWVPLGDAGRREAILLAVEQHDNGWREPDAAPSVDPATGRVQDFITIPPEVRQSVWPRGVARLAERDTWAAALVAHHAVFVYDRFRSDPAWPAFFARMEAMRDGLVERSGPSGPDLLADYTFLRIGDLISLIFCNRWTDPPPYQGFTFGFADDRVTIAPDPFAGREIAMAIEAREMADAPWRSDAGLRDALKAAPVVTLRGIASGPR